MPEGTSESQAVAALTHLAPYDVARAALAEDAEPPTDDQQAIGMLADELAPALASLIDDLRVRSSNSAAQDEDILWLDAVLANRLQRLGREGRSLAERVRRTSVVVCDEDEHQVWRLWTGAHPQAARLLALAIYYEVVEPRLQRRRRNEPAVSLTVAQEMVRVHHHGNEVRTSENGVVLVDRDQRWVVEAETDGQDGVAVVDSAVLSAALESLSTIYAHRVFRWEIRRAYEQHADHHPDPRVLRIDGGWSGLAEAVGVEPNHRDRVRSVILAQAHGFFRWPDGSGNMLSYTMRPEAPGRPAELVLTLGDMLLPNYVFRFRGGPRHRCLVPLVDLPPSCGRDNEYAGLANFQLRLLVEFRLRAAELRQRGGIALSDADLDHLAFEAGLPLALAHRALDHWSHDSDDAPAFLSVVERGRYTLGPTHHRALAFLLASADRSEKAAARARRGNSPRHR